MFCYISHDFSLVNVYRKMFNGVILLGISVVILQISITINFKFNI